MYIEWDDEEQSQAFAPCREAVTRALQAGAQRLQLPEDCVLSVLVVDEETIRQINAQTRQIDAATDVLSFPMLQLASGQKAPQLPWQDFALDRDPETGRLYLGDVVLCMQAIVRQGEEYGHGIQRESAFLALHGLLHVTGYDHLDEAQEAEMMGLAEEILASVQLPRCAQSVQPSEE